MSDPIVELQELTKHYRQGELTVEALRGLSLSVGKGEFTALCGPSGSGKTTALNLIGALDTPTSGRVFLEGRDLGTLSRRELSHLRRDRIGFVFQAYNLMPVLTAYENAEIVLVLKGVPPAEREARVMELLSLSAPTRTKQGHDFPVIDVEGEVLYRRLRASRIGLRQAHEPHGNLGVAAVFFYRASSWGC